LLEQAVGALADALNKKFNLYLGSLKDALIKYSMKNTYRKIRLETNHRFELYGALVTNDE
jgi:hypothetical protein